MIKTIKQYENKVMEEARRNGWEIHDITEEYRHAVEVFKIARISPYNNGEDL